MIFMIEIPGRSPAKCLVAPDEMRLANYLMRQNGNYKIKRTLDAQLDAHHLGLNALLIFKGREEAERVFNDPERWTWERGDEARKALGKVLSDDNTNTS